MFRREGPSREPRKNIQLAAYLAATAGFVNSGGYVLIGSFTSHVTGSVGRIASNIAEGEPAASLSAATLVVAFFGGAFAASLILEPRKAALVATRYGVSLAIEAALLACFIFIAGLSRASHPRILDAQAVLLCAAMGMQNSMMTRLSGAVVRTTHLTGVVTDLGIETARWYRFQQRKLLGAAATGEGMAELSPPSSDRITLLLTIVASFMVGGISGAVLTEHASRWAMCLPVAAILLASAFALAQARGAKISTEL